MSARKTGRTTRRLTHIDGRVLYTAFAAGSNKILAHQQYMNRINVFPVPDGDTGTNLAATVQHILDETRPQRSLKLTADAMASAALDGARGNSGIILAQFLYGFSQKIREHQINVRRFAGAINRAFQCALQAIERPVEGTIITVMRDWIRHVDSLKESRDDFGQLITESLKSATRSLKQTPEKLKVLRQNKVVDAGAQGFVFFLEGIIEFLKASNPRALLRSMRRASLPPAVNEPLHSGPPQHRYCTEAIVEGKDMDFNRIRLAVSGMGDSLVLAGSPEKLRLHVHSNDPAHVFAYLRPFGRITRQKADDMEMQYQVMNHRRADIALVTDSVCDMPLDAMQEMQVHMVPLNLHFGEAGFLDKVTMTPDHFYTQAETARLFPTTSQPSHREFETTYRFLASHYPSIIAIHLSRQLSGTWQNSRLAAEKVARETGRRITVIDSRQLSGSLGLIVYRAAAAILNGANHDEVVRRAESWREQTRILVSVKTMEFMVRGGRVSPLKGRLARAMNLKPIISLDAEGKSVLYDKAFSHKGNMRKVLRLINRQLDRGALWNYCMLHAHNPLDAAWFSRQIEKETGKPPLYTVDISPVVGANAGKGAVAVALMTDVRT
ncbi:MAG TPA: DegV family EDD domain-containing protein [Candidatus Aminicenantes bacterium]|nr:DegV family EDD domain-containing protein [Candidatus Aminicenantes bacterium]